MPPKKRSSVERTIALCYIRQSYTRDAKDMHSPERQHELILAECERNDWTPEWYQDTDGHRSGTKEKNRPGWLALKARLNDPDIAAIIAYDLSRIHRKGWRIGDLVDFVVEHDIRLVLTRPGQQVDLSSLQGRILVQFIAMLDEWYAADISERSRNTAAHRRAAGKSMGVPPFGTIRGADGYLKPSPAGAWLMPDGTFLTGSKDEPPDPGALWRSYFEAAERVLQLYRSGDIGMEYVAYQMQIEGWAFRGRDKLPQPFERDDVRRIVSNWPEYGGFVLRKSAKDRRPMDYDLDNIPFNEERAIYDLKLLHDVARARRARTIVKPVGDGEKKSDYPYPLNGITYCAHCEQLAREHRDPRLRSRLGGKDRDSVRRYRHKSGALCGCTNKSVRGDIYESDFARLIELLTIRPEAMDYMLEMQVQADKLGNPDRDASDPEKQKIQAIALCRRRIDAAVTLYGDGRISKEEYRRRVEANELEIAHWETRTSETEKAAMELAMCVEAMNKFARLWAMSSDEDKQGMARGLFSYLVFNLDTQRIEDFRLKPWADRFLMLRSALYEDEGNENADTSKSSASQGVSKAVPHRGIRAKSFLEDDDTQGLRNNLPHRRIEPLFWP